MDKVIGWILLVIVLIGVDYAYSLEPNTVKEVSVGVFCTNVKDATLSGDEMELTGQCVMSIGTVYVVKRVMLKTVCTGTYEILEVRVALIEQTAYLVNYLQFDRCLKI